MVGMERSYPGNSGWGGCLVICKPLNDLHTGGARSPSAAFSCIPHASLPCIPHCPCVRTGTLRSSWAPQPGLQDTDLLPGSHCSGSIRPPSFWAPGRFPGSTPLSPKQIPLWPSASQGVVCWEPTGWSQGGMLKMQIPYCTVPSVGPGKKHLMVTFLNEYTWFVVIHAEVCKHLSISDFSHSCFFFSSTSLYIAHKNSPKEQEWRL